MPWLRVGDNAATYPALLAALGQSGADDRTVNEVAGWVFRMSCQSAAHLTDRVIDLGTAWMLGGSRTEVLAKVALRVGLLERKAVPGRGQCFVIVDDEEFVHVPTRAEVEWKRQQGRDTTDTTLTVHVRRRDGDQCRWCRTVVLWRGRSSNRKGTIDHLNPGQAGTVDTLVVACLRCNSSRQNNPQWVDDHPLLDPPARPLYARWTADFLSDNGYDTEPNIGPEAGAQRPGNHPGTASRTATPQGEAGALRPSDPDTARHTPVRPGHRTDTATPSAAPEGATATPQGPDRMSPGKSPPGPLESHYPGSGRDGSGRVRVGDGSGPGSGRDGAGSLPARRRGRRGGRSAAANGGGVQ